MTWDELLRCRSEVFVMEEEYRKHKAKEDHRKSTVVRSSEEATKLSQKLEDTTLEETKAELSKPANVEKPKQVADESKEATGEAEQQSEVNISFGNKRLCERWLDNLFMVLYEDLRVYTFWRAEDAHYRAQQTAYRKTGTEWELLGDLALRLWHEVGYKFPYN